MCPMGNKPDCFNCPLPDCKANCLDLTRQAAAEKRQSLEKRDKIIVDEYLKGTDMIGLSERFGFRDPTNVRRILKKAGVDVNKIEKERRICWK